jgi:hypothetical protein
VEVAVVQLQAPVALFLGKRDPYIHGLGDGRGPKFCNKIITVIILFLKIRKEFI